MKKNFTLLFVMMLAVASLFAQAPQKMTYQAVVRGSDNALVANQNVSVRISILQGSIYGASVYVETHSAATNANGLLTIEVGGGSVLNGSLQDVDWSNGPFYLKSQIDPNGGVSYSIESIQQLLSVPYALYAASAGNVPAFAMTPTDTGYVMVLTMPDGTVQSYVLRHGQEGPQGPQGPAGATGATGATGPVGPAGPAGATGATGPQGPAGPAGADGTNGQDGFSPVVTTSPTANGTQVTITDATGPHIFIIQNGQNGTDGTNGANGVGIQNISGPVTSGLSDTYTIHYTDGSTSTFVVHNGATGPAGPAGPAGAAGATGATGPQGPAGSAGADGTNGQDGFSPVVTTSPTANGTQVTITDATGPHTFIIQNGQNGTDGTNGANGVGIQNISGPVTSGLSDTYTIHYTDGSTSTFVVHNGATGPAGPAGAAGATGATGPQGPAGAAGANGANGQDGQDGFSPVVNTVTAGDSTVVTITDASGPHTFVVRNGEQGPVGATGPQGPAGPAGTNGTNGLNGQDGRGIQSVTGPVSAGNVDTYTIHYTDNTTSTFTVTNGLDGTAAAVGVGIQFITKTGTSGLVDTYTITYTDGTTSTYEVANGAPGANGSNGANGQDGFSPVVNTVTAGDSTTVTITDVNGTHTFVVHNGIQGPEGATGPAGPAGTNGANGADGRGIQTIAMTGTSGNVDTYTITYTDGTTYTYTVTNGTNGGGVAQVNADWNATSGVEEILNKPTNVSAFINDAGYLTSDSLANRNALLDALQQAVLGDFACGVSTVTDYDGNTYNTVKIGNQCWMKENLRTSHYSNGNGLSRFYPNFDWTDTLCYGCFGTTNIPSFCPPGNVENIPADYGYLYNEAAVSDHDWGGYMGLNLCPDGWHLPNDADWNQLVSYVGSKQEYVCGGNSNDIARALAANDSWPDYCAWNNCIVCGNASGRNATGFSAFPAGMGRIWEWAGFPEIASFWGVTKSLSISLYDSFVQVGDLRGIADQMPEMRSYAWQSIRCLRDEQSVGDYMQVLDSLAPVAFSGDYNDLSNRPTIPAEQVNADWNATSGKAQILNKPTIPTVPTNVSAFTNDAGYLTAANVQQAANIPTNVSAFTNDAGYLTADSLENLNDQINALQQAIDSLRQIVADDHFECGTSTLNDIDGNVYNTVRIGSQCWMRENLRTTRFADGSIINAGSTNTYNNSTISNRYAPYHDESKVATYGYLYNWSAVMHGAASSNTNPSGVQGVCPDGWHVPSTAEWTRLTDYVSGHPEYACGGNNGNIAKSLSSTIGWDSSSDNCTVGNDFSSNNTTGFSALPAGRYANYYDRDNEHFGVYAYFWTTSEQYNVFYLYYNSANVRKYNGDKRQGASVRCLRDNSSSVEQIQDLNEQLLVQQNLYDSLKSVYDSIIALMRDQINVLQQVVSENRFACGISTITDVDGNTYNTVKIGSQCWMKENLRTTRYADSTEIPLGIDTTVVIPIGGNTDVNNTNPCRRVPNNDENNVATYGYLYNWSAVMHGTASSSTNPSGVQGICPIGWHVPSDAEWTQLTDYVSSQPEYTCGGNPDYIAKALSSTIGWNSSSYNCTVGNNLSANNATGFSALPAGCSIWGDVGGLGAAHYGYFFDGFGYFAGFWTTTRDNNQLNTRAIFSDERVVDRLDVYDGMSVRCLRNNTASDGQTGMPQGAAVGDMLYWTGTTWVTVPAGQQGQQLVMDGGTPTWQTPVDNSLHYILFNANGGSGTMNAQFFPNGVQQTVSANTFTRSGFIFTGWNTAADGTGTSYAPDAVLTLTGNITLYAQWTTRVTVPAPVPCGDTNQRGGTNARP